MISTGWIFEQPWVGNTESTGAVIPAHSWRSDQGAENVEAPLKTIEQAVDNVLARRGINTNADSGTIHNVIKLDGQILYDAFKKIDKRVGKSLLAGAEYDDSD